MTLQEVLEVRLGRNFIRKGDVVKITPSKPGKRDGGLATVEKITETTDGIEFHVAMTKEVKTKHGTSVRAGLRVFREDRIQRVQQVRGGEQRKAR